MKYTQIIKKNQSPHHTPFMLYFRSQQSHHLITNPQMDTF